MPVLPAQAQALPPGGATPRRTVVLPPRLLGRTVAALREALADLPPDAVLALHTADP